MLANRMLTAITDTAMMALLSIARGICRASSLIMARSVPLLFEDVGRVPKKM